MRICINNLRIYPNDKDYVEGKILIEDEKIVGIYNKETKIEADSYIDGNNLIALPGLIDIHLHGSYGYDFVKSQKEAVEAVSFGLLKEGTTSFMASLTVTSHEETCKILKEFSKVKNKEEHSEFLGVHLEGPYLSKEYKALMIEEYLRDPDLKELDEMLENANGVLKIMTIAPERKGMEEFIPKLVSNNIVPMIGHSNASCKEALRGIELGAKGFTHLYNAMSPHRHRDPGCVSAALLDEKTYKELIVDGFHVDEDVVKSTYKMLGKEEIILITDAMLGKGMEDGDYYFSNLNCRKKGNTVQVIETGRIAGSAITMLDAIRNIRRMCNVSYNDIVKMASINPATLLNINNKKGSLDPNLDADFILVDDDLNLHETWVKGRQAYKANL